MEKEKLNLMDKLRVLKTYFIGDSNEIKAMGTHNAKNHFYTSIGAYYHPMGIMSAPIGIFLSAVTLNPLPAMVSITYLTDAYLRSQKSHFCCGGLNHYHGPGLIGTMRDKLSAPSNLEETVQQA